MNGLSKPSLIALFIDLLTLYFNDKNSSRLRELTNLWVFGYNGYRMDADTGRRVDCEVKPQNTDDPRKKLNGGGSFNDYTLQRFSKDLENNPIILVSGFIFPKGQRKEGEYLRSAGFSFRDYLSRDLTKYFEGLKK